MQKTYFHDRKHNSEKKVQKKTIPLQYIDQKRIVDINKLLERVRIDQKNDIKKNGISIPICLPKNIKKIQRLKIKDIIKN